MKVFFTLILTIIFVSCGQNTNLRTPSLTFSNDSGSEEASLMASLRKVSIEVGDAPGGGKDKYIWSLIVESNTDLSDISRLRGGWESLSKIGSKKFQVTFKTLGGKDGVSFIADQNANIHVYGNVMFAGPGGPVFEKVDYSLGSSFSTTKTFMKGAVELTQQPRN